MQLNDVIKTSNTVCYAASAFGGFLYDENKNFTIRKDFSSIVTI